MKGYLALIILAGICAQGLGRKGRKIVFDTSTPLHEAEYSNEDRPAVGTEEYYDSFRWVGVTRDGYEYEGTLEEAKAVLMDDNGPSMPVEDKYYWENLQLKEALTDELPEISTQGVFAESELEKVSSPSEKVPYRLFGLFDVGCTGTLIGKKTVLTAGKCIYNPKSKKWYEKLNFQLGKDCKPDEGKVLKWERALVFSGWKNGKRYTHNMGIVILRDPNPSYLLIAALSEFKRNIPYHITGYPISKADLCMYDTSCTNPSRYKGLIKHDCATSRMSGSGFYLSIPFPVIRGVHLGNFKDHGKLAVALQSGHVKMIQYWIAAFGGN